MIWILMIRTSMMMIMMMILMIFEDFDKIGQPD